MANRSEGPALNGGDDTNFNIPDIEIDEGITIELPPEGGVTPPVDQTPPNVDGTAGAKEGGATPPTGTPPTASPAPAPTVTAPPSPAPGGPQPQSTAAAPQPTPSGSTQPAPGAQTEQPQTWEDQFKASQAQLEAWMAQNVFALSDADKEELIGSSDTFVPKMAAKTLALAIASVHRQIQSFVPRMIIDGIRAYEGQKVVEKEAEGLFFGRWPALKGHDEKIEPILDQYMKLFPGKSRDEVIEAVGLMAHHSLGIPIPPPKGNGRTNPPAPPVTRTPVPAFQPAGGGAAMGGAPPTPDDDPWAGFTTPHSGD